MNKSEDEPFVQGPPVNPTVVSAAIAQEVLDQSSEWMVTLQSSNFPEIQAIALVLLELHATPEHYQRVGQNLRSLLNF